MDSVKSVAIDDYFVLYQARIWAFLSKIQNNGKRF